MADDLNGTQNATNATPDAGTTPKAGKSWEETYFGKKYGTPEKAEAGVIELTKYASDTKTKLETVEQENARLKAALVGGGSTSAVQSGSTSALDQLSEAVIVDKNLFKGAFAEVLAELMAPAASIQRAQAEYTEANPDFKDRAPKVYEWAESNPEIKQRFQNLEKGDALGAVEWLDLQFQLKNAGTTTSKLPDEVVESRTHNGSPSQMGPTVRNPQGGDDNAKLVQAAEKFAAEPTAENKAVLRGTYLDGTAGKQEFLKQMQTALGFGG